MSPDAPAPSIMMSAFLVFVGMGDYSKQGRFVCLSVLICTEQFLGKSLDVRLRDFVDFYI